MILPPCGWALAAIWVCLELFQLTGEARLAYGDPCPERSGIVSVRAQCNGARLNRT
ncbi:MAG: hypothetical protein JWM63_1616 [Gammaproteobacteria bacterium]|nr:hypothetical protein [Gammaproteobacteria bacterium]